MCLPRQQCKQVLESWAGCLCRITDALTGAGARAVDGIWCSPASGAAVVGPMTVLLRPLIMIIRHAHTIHLKSAKKSQPVAGLDVADHER